METKSIMMKFYRGRIFLKIYYFGYVTERDFWKQNPDKKFQNVLVIYFELSIDSIEEN